VARGSAARRESHEPRQGSCISVMHPAAWKSPPARSVPILPLQSPLI
jgi:hypothetical protein